MTRRQPFREWAGGLDARVGFGPDPQANADAALLDAWHLIHPTKPWTGETGDGGPVGWANRLDDRVFGRGRDGRQRAQIPVQPRELLRAMLTSWLAIPVGALIVVAFVVVPSPGATPLVLAIWAGYMIPVANRLRAGKRSAMYAEIGARAANDDDFAARPEVVAILGQCRLDTSAR